MIHIHDVTFRIVTDADGLISITVIRSKKVNFSEPTAEEFDEKESEEN